MCETSSCGIVSLFPVGLFEFFVRVCVGTTALETLMEPEWSPNGALMEPEWSPTGKSL